MIDMLIVPSLLNESLGRVVLEAYSCGIPVIGSNRGGIPEIVVEGETGFLFDPDIPDSLTELLRFACSNPHRIHAMKPACLEMAKRFAPEVIANHYLGVYEQVLSQYHAVS
jgi:glycosyltransferase involved in cell wall biosynthesis